MEERDILAPVDAALKLFAVNDAATQTASRKLMVKALRNLEREPSNEKFRKLRVANKVVQAKIINVRGAQQLMACGGFYNKGEFLEALGEDCAVKAKAVADALEKSDGTFQTVNQDRQITALQQAAAAMEETYPVFDRNSESFNEEYTKQVVELRNAFITQGYEAVDALGKAVKYVVKDRDLDGAVEEAPSLSGKFKST